MNDDRLDLSDTVATTRFPQRFPVVWQLAGLVLLLGALFSFAIGSPLALISSLIQGATPSPEESPASALPTTAADAGAPYTIDEAAVPVSAQAAFVWDVVGQRVLYAKNSDETLPLASITKLMTALVAYELVEAETTAAVPAAATRVQSASGLASGETFTLKTLTDLALLSSSNDAAYSLAAAVGDSLGSGNPTAQFVAAMNIRAEELGLDSLQFANMTGLDVSASKAGAYGNARDVTFLVEHLLREYPELLAITRTDERRFYSETGEYHDAENTNPIIHSIPNLLASKTGYTDLAGGNLTIAFDAGFNRPIIVTVLGSSLRGRFTDVERLVDAALYND